MSRTLKKKKHWSSKVQECAVSWGSLGEFGNVVEVLGGAEHGEFPYLGQMKLDVMLCHVGTMPYFGDVLLEINGTPVSGLTNRDTHAVIRHFREPIRLKTVKPGASSFILQVFDIQKWPRYISLHMLYARVVNQLTLPVE
ncbi:unnamed protein product [Oncorhynchus mykiss]|uniref:PDZ domain-containing protein n=1 Tax=Oncorhynchus mykiss TaxID=8022 RepID=A0A060WQI5_ONCMY|nr:unnamed protein product [Oncorhynchus mykiss]